MAVETGKQTGEIAIEAFDGGLLDWPRPDDTQSLWEKVVQATRAAEVGRITGVDQGLLNQLTIDVLVTQMAYLERLQQEFIKRR